MVHQCLRVYMCMRLRMYVPGWSSRDPVSTRGQLKLIVNSYWQCTIVRFVITRFSL